MSTTTKIAGITTALCLMIFTSQAQNWLGHNTDNYAGLQQVHLQPASVSSMPYKLDIGILGLQASAYNIGGLSSLYALSTGSSLEALEDEQDFLLDFTLQLPSLAMKIDDRSAFAFEAKWSGRFYVESSDNDVISLLNQGFDDPAFFGRSFDNIYLTGRSHIWWDFAGTYARQLYKSDVHQIDAGATLKVIYGTGSVYFNIDDLSFRILDENTLADVSGQAQFVYTPRIQALVDDGQLDLFDASSIGTSFGSEYRWTPSGEDRYRLKAGFAILDIGSIKYRKASDSEEYALNSAVVSYGTFEDVKSLESLADSLESTFEVVGGNTEGEKVSISMPTKLSLQFDYRLVNDFYLNFSTHFALSGAQRRVDETFNTTAIVLTPRYEKMLWGIQLPIYYSKVSGMNTGISGRIGPVFLGMDNVIASLAAADLDRLTAFIGFKVRGWSKKNDF